jgi:hypothetical protein
MRLGADYLDIPIVVGAGAGCLDAQAPRLNDAAAKATTAAILTNFIKIFPLLSPLVATFDIHVSRTSDKQNPIFIRRFPRVCRMGGSRKARLNPATGA